MTKEAMKLALEALQKTRYRSLCDEIADPAIVALREALAEQPAQQEPVLQEIEQYRLQMAGISTAAIGYWKESDGIHPDYDTIALRDVAKLYAKYDELYRAQPVPHAVIAGALFDFMCWLTSRPKRIMLSSVDDASPAVDAIKDFAKMRGLSLDDAQVQTWQKALAEQPAQQEPKIDIYRSFEQWKSGNVLEHGVPRTEHYSEAQLDLVEMGWNYGYDAGRAVEQALDKKAENARELGLDYEPAQEQGLYSAPIKELWPVAKPWVSLTDEEIESIFNNWPTYHLDHEDFARVIEAKLKEKNT